jgi:hypothetical protein
LQLNKKRLDEISQRKKKSVVTDGYDRYSNNKKQIHAIDAAVRQ